MSPIFAFGFGDLCMLFVGLLLLGGLLIAAAAACTFLDQATKKPGGGKQHHDKRPLPKWVQRKCEQSFKAGENHGKKKR